MSYYEPITYHVAAEEDGWLLKTVLQRKLKISRKLLSRLKRTDQGITVNGQRQFVNVAVNCGDRVEIRMEREESAQILPQDLKFHILYEDPHLLLVNKEAGMIVHPTHGHYVNTLANAVVYHWERQGERCRFRPVHRLDQDTSGVLCIAKTPFVHQNIAEQMKKRQVKKEYLAIVHGELAMEKGTIHEPIARNPIDPHVRMVSEGGRDAVTHYWIVQRFSSATLIKLQLETGRTHQIRVHLQHQGHPLFGDSMYGQATPSLLYPDAAINSWISRQALHASTLGFIHPVTKQPMEFIADLPGDMKQVLSHLKAWGSNKELKLV